MDDNKDDDPKNGLNAEDADLWREMTKDVKPLPGREYKPAASTPKKATKAKKDKPVHTQMPPKAKSKPIARGRDIDAATAKRLKRGDMPIEGKLDLHGMNQGDARNALINFIVNAQSAGKRCVLIVTGKGNTGRTSQDWLAREPGVLRRNVPLWLYESELSSIVLQAVSAQPKHGGEGALYVYLRRRRDLTPPPEPYV